MAKFKISMRNAMKYIEFLEEEIKSDYGISIKNDDDELPLNSGCVSDGPTGTFNIRVNQPIRVEGIFQNYANTMDFVNYLRILHHEEQHIIQSTIDLYKTNGCGEANIDDKVQMAIKNIAVFGNKDYYNGENHRYNTNLAEINAEYTAILKTYDFLYDNVSPEHAEQLVCDMVNEKSLHSDYFIQGQYDNLDNIAEAFSDQYERAKFSHVSHMVIRLRPTQQVNPDDDEYIQYLQQTVKDDVKNEWLMKQFWDVTDVDEKDKMVASIVLHIHPEIDYRKLYPCLRLEDLSPETIFGQNIPDVPSIDYYDEELRTWSTKQIGTTLSETMMIFRIEKANDLHASLKSNNDNTTPNKEKQETDVKLHDDLTLGKSIDEGMSL